MNKIRKSKSALRALVLACPIAAQALPLIGDDGGAAPGNTNACTGPEAR